MVYVARKWLDAALPLLKRAQPAHNLHYLDVGLHNQIFQGNVHNTEEKISCRPRVLRLRGPPVWGTVEDGFLSRVGRFEYIERYYSESRWRSDMPLRTLASYLQAMLEVRSIHLSDIVFSDAMLALLHQADDLATASFTFAALTHVEFHRVQDLGLDALWAPVLTPHLQSLTMVHRNRRESQPGDGNEPKVALHHEGSFKGNPQLQHLDLVQLFVYPTCGGPRSSKKPPPTHTPPDPADCEPLLLGAHPRPRPRSSRPSARVASVGSADRISRPSDPSRISSWRMRCRCESTIVQASCVGGGFWEDRGSGA